MPVKILVVDNQPIVYEGLKSSAGPDYEFLGLVSNPRELVETIALNRPNVLISETRFASQDVLGVIERMFHDPKQLKIVIFSGSDDVTAVARASAIGVDDYVLKSSPVSHVFESVQNALNGKEPGENSVLTTVKSRMRRPRQNVSEDVPLTKRELQVLQHVALGLSNREVGKSLGISVETAKEHVQNILRKLDVNDRTQAAVWAVKRGLA